MNSGSVQGSADDLYELITERVGRSLILTSNRTPAGHASPAHRARHRPSVEQHPGH
jgi:hypothetical protein